GSEVLLWSCLPITGSAGLAPDLRGALPPGVEPGCVRHHQVPVDEQVVVQGVAVAPLPVWMLACAPGLCGDLQGVDDAQLEDPLDWLTELPVSGVSAASRAAPLHMEGEEPALNPPIEESPPLLVEGATGQVIPLSFLAPGAQIAFGYTTAGGFSMPSYDVSSEGRVALSWVAPEEPGAARLYVVVEDGRGGSTLWRGDAAIR
ncbi:MAG: hypothetical protein KTR31_11750, partial [Myxococcales bacterium]|nr:hypothetical protein [Myxococcales bacterium]